MIKTRDIVNRDIVSLTNCDQEPIHIPGSIQPHGFLIGVKDDDYTIDFCSGNCIDYTGNAYQQFLGKSFHSVFGEETEDRLKTYIADISPLASSPLIIYFNNKQFFCSIHKSNNIFIIEIEPVTEVSIHLVNTYDQTRQFLSYIEQTKTLKELCDSVAKGTRTITGYDRVMIYRFDEQYNGEVYAESVREDLEPFYGLHYPHTDIPVQARELYIKNLLRLIADINYTPSPIYTLDDAANKNLDLSHSILRSISPIHVQYLQNMGVGATLTISLLHQGRLWGLITCHHYSYKNLPHSLRIAAQLQGHFLTSQIDVRQSNEEYEVARKSNDALEKFLSEVFEHDQNSFSQIISNPQTLNVCNATGVAIIINNTVYTAGKTPGEKDIIGIADYVSEKYKQTGLTTNNLSSYLPDTAAMCDVAAGIIYHSLSLSDDNDCIMWFRSETVTEVNWGGDPNKAIIKDEKGLHPRNSFKLWKEVVKCRSKPWLRPELNAAANFAYTLQKHATLLALSKEEERYRKLTEVLKENNEELENINWISTHDLQEPLRKIQIMGSRLQSFSDNTLPGKMNDIVVRMNVAAARMQNLLKDILSYTKIKHTDAVFQKVQLEEILNEIISSADENIKEKKALVAVKTLPQINGISFLLKQLFTNLVINALKFSDKERQQVITIQCESIFKYNDISDHDFYMISVSDTGIGFEQKFAESIFHIFKRLHSQDAYQGSGVGLALCKKIMSTHNGFINAASTPGEGSTFNLYFPKSTASAN